MSLAAQSVIQSLGLVRELLDRLEEQVRAFDSDATSIMPVPVSSQEQVVESIISKMIEWAGFSRADLLCRRKHPELLDSRHIAIYLAWCHTTLPTITIARLFGNRQNGTIFYSLRRIRNLISTEPAFAIKVATLESRVAAELNLRILRNPESIE